VFSPFKVVEIATEADFDYVSAFGGDSTSTNNNILSIMNQVQAIYERDIGLTFTVCSNTPGRLRPTLTNATDAVTALNEFTIIGTLTSPPPVGMMYICGRVGIWAGRGHRLDGRGLPSI